MADSASASTFKSSLTDLFAAYIRKDDGVSTSQDFVGEPPPAKLAKVAPAGPNDLGLLLESHKLPGDFTKLRSKFQDAEQVRQVTESTLTELLVLCSNHDACAGLLFSAMESLVETGDLRWDPFTLKFLKVVATAETSAATAFVSALRTDPAAAGVASCQAISEAVRRPTAGTGVAAQAPAHHLGSAAPLPTLTTSRNPSPAHSGRTGTRSASQGAASPWSSGVAALAVPWVRVLACRVILAAIKAGLQPTTYVEIGAQVATWLDGYATLREGSDLADEAAVAAHDGASSQAAQSDSRQPGSTTTSTLGLVPPPPWPGLLECLQIARALTEAPSCHMPIYALLHDRLQVSMPAVSEDPDLLAFMLELERRRERLRLYASPASVHLIGPTFATLRLGLLTFSGPSCEPLHGLELAEAIPRGTVEWERAVRCLRLAFCCHPSLEWWKYALHSAPRYRQLSNTGMPITAYSQFSSEMVSEAVIDHILKLLQPLPPSAPGVVADKGGGSASSALGAGGTPAAVASLGPDGAGRWQEWLAFADTFYLLLRSFYIDVVYFIDRLSIRLAEVDAESGGTALLRGGSCLVTWLLLQVFRLDIFAVGLREGPTKTETASKVALLLPEKASALGDVVGCSKAVSMLLEYVGSSVVLRLWSTNRATVDHVLGPRMSEHHAHGKALDDWWHHVKPGERSLDYANLDETSLGMVWNLSHTMSQPLCDAMVAWLRSRGLVDVLPAGATGDRLQAVQEMRPLPMALLQGLSLQMSLRLSASLEEAIFSCQVLPSLAMLETYARLLLIAPNTLFKPRMISTLSQYVSGTPKGLVVMVLLDLYSTRLLPYFRYHGKTKALLLDMAPILIKVRHIRGDHRVYRAAESLALLLVGMSRDILIVKKDYKGTSTDFSETLNRAMVQNISFTVKTRGILDIEQAYVFRPAIEQMILSSTHNWSEATRKHMPKLTRDLLEQRPDKTNHYLKAWQQAEATALHQCRQLLLPGADTSYMVSYVSHVPAQQRQFLCAAAWSLMNCQLDTINLGTLMCVLKEFTPEEVTLNILVLVDVLLQGLGQQVQTGATLTDVVARAGATLAHLLWVAELLPFDTFLLALADRDHHPLALPLVSNVLVERPEFQERARKYAQERGSQDHWSLPGPFVRRESKTALGTHFAGRELHPVFFDDFCLRAIPVIPLVTFRMIENEAFDSAEALLTNYAPLLAYHPGLFLFVRDTLAYYYSSLPLKLILSLLSLLDKVPFSEGFLSHIRSDHADTPPPPEYYSALLHSLAAVIIPPLFPCTPKMPSEPQAPPAVPETDATQPNLRPPSATLAGTAGPHDVRPLTGAARVVAKFHQDAARGFLNHQGCNTRSHFLLETAAIELLSMSTITSHSISILIRIATGFKSQPLPLLPPPLSSAHSGVSSGNQTASDLFSPSGGGSVTPTSPPECPWVPFLRHPPGSSTSSGPTAIPYTTTADAGSRVAVVQACGQLLGQIVCFHKAFYLEVARLLQDCRWLANASRGGREVNAMLTRVFADTSKAADDRTLTPLGALIAVVHAHSALLTFDTLESSHQMILPLRPVRSAAMLRVAFRLLGPITQRSCANRPFCTKTVALMFSILSDVYGANTPPPSEADVESISDLADFIHHIVMLEGGTGNLPGARPRADTLTRCGKAVALLHPSVQPLFRHLTDDQSQSIYAAGHPKIVPNHPASSRAAAGLGPP